MLHIPLNHSLLIYILIQEHIVLGFSSQVNSPQVTRIVCGGNFFVQLFLPLLRKKNMEKVQTQKCFTLQDDWKLRQKSCRQASNWWENRTAFTLVHLILQLHCCWIWRLCSQILMLQYPLSYYDTLHVGLSLESIQKAFIP